MAVVVAFHAHWLTGGYLGVDLFFVLSGFLITRLLLDEHQRTNRINLRRFWTRRVRRLLPALLAVVAVVAVADRWRGRLDGPGGARQDIIGTLTYTVNWLRLDAGAGYWRTFGGPLLLDHTWSLAIEEQFYLIWPLVTLLLLRLTRSTGERVAILLVASGAFAWWSLQAFAMWSDASRIYMGTDTRAVALLLGATVAALSQWRPGADRWFRWMAPPAVICLTVAMLGMRGDAVITYRGGLVACSVAGAVLVATAATAEPWWVLRPLTTAPMTWLGLRSYGIYLWHWPILVWCGVAGTQGAGIAQTTAAIALSLAAAELSYRWIEQPVRQRGLRAFGPPSRVLGLASAAIAVTVFAITLPTFGNPSSAALPLPNLPGIGEALVSDEVAPVTTASTRIAENPPVTQPFNGPTFTSTTTTTSPIVSPVLAAPSDRRPRLMFVGDSVGWFLGVQATSDAELLGIEALNVAEPECPLADGALKRRSDPNSVPLVFPDRCAETVNAYAESVAELRPDVVIMVFGASLFDENEISPGQWHAVCSPTFNNWYQDQLRRSAADLASTGATVYLATQAYYRAEVDDRTPVLDDQIDCLNALTTEVAAQSSGAIGLLHLGKWTCPDRNCLQEREGITLRSDGTHYTDAGAALANIWMLQQIFNPPPWQQAGA